MSNPSLQPVIVWFRDDLRLSDHPALHTAVQSGAPVVCLYVLDEESTSLRPPHGRPLGGASRWWLAQSLRSLQASLKALGQSLVLRRGATEKSSRASRKRLKRQPSTGSKATSPVPQPSNAT